MAYQRKNRYPYEKKQTNYITARIANEKNIFYVSYV